VTRRDLFKALMGGVMALFMPKGKGSRVADVVKMPSTTSSSASTTTSSDSRVYIWESDGFDGQFYTIKGFDFFYTENNEDGEPI
jgi:hypothetical protein